MISFTFGLKILASSEPYVGYANGTSRSTQNLSSATWAIFSLNGELVSLQGICVSFSTNNIVEYNIIFKLVSFVISHGICCLSLDLTHNL